MGRVGCFPVVPTSGIVRSLESAVHYVRWISVAIAAVSFAGCASLSGPAKIRTRDGRSFTLPVWTTDGMYLVTGYSGALFVTSAPPDWTYYRGVVLEEIVISTKHRSRDLKPGEEKRLKGYFTRRLEHVFERNGWPMVEAPGDDVLRVRLAVKGLDLPRFRRSHVGTIVANSSTGGITIVLELRDAVKNDRRLLFGEKRKLPFGVYSGLDSVSIRRVEDAFYDFSIDIRRRLSQVQSGKFPPPPPPPLPSRTTNAGGRGHSMQPRHLAQPFSPAPREFAATRD